MTAPSLRELQERLASLIVSPGSLPAAEADLGETFRVPADESMIRRVRVYIDGYPARIHESLEETFPALFHILAHRQRHALVERYLAESPPLSYNLNEAGAALPDFLRRDGLASDLPFVVDLAELEWAVARAFHARLAPPFDVALLRDWSMEEWTRAVIRFQPGVAVICSDWPVRDIWDARETPREEIDIDLNDRPQNVLVHRRDTAVLCPTIDAAQARALASLRDGETLGAVIESLAGAGHDPTGVTAWFQSWSAAGLIAGVQAA